MIREASHDTDTQHISRVLLEAGNVLLIGPNRDLIRQIQAKVCAVLAADARVYFAKNEWTMECSFQLIKDEIDSATRSGSTHLVISSISPEVYFDLVESYGHFCYFSALRAANHFSASMQLAGALQKKMGENSSCIPILLESALSALYPTSVSKSSVHPPSQGSFREKLKSGRYNRSKPVLTDDGSLLRGWTQEGEGCDPGWELDK